MIIGSALWSAIFQNNENNSPLAKNFPAKPSTSKKYEPHRMAVQKHIDLDLKPDFARKTMRGKARIVFEVKSETIDELILDAKEMEILGVEIAAVDAAKPSSAYSDSALLGSVQPIGFRSGDDFLTIYGLQELRELWQRTQLFSLNIEYRIRSPRAGLYFVDPKDSPWVSMPCMWTQGQDSDAPYWFPCQDDPRLKVTTTIRCDSPDGWHLYANGEKRSDGSWHMPVPHSVYLVAIACGPFAIFEEHWKGKPVNVLVPKGFKDLGMSILKTTIKMLDFYSQYWGFSFPWPSYTQAFVPEFIYGGMENSTLTINTDAVLGESLYAETLADWRDSLIMHEMAHQWFGDWVTCESWSEGWLNEGFATQSEMLWEEHAYGAVTGIFYSLKYFLEPYLEESAVYKRPLVCNHYEFPSEIFDRHLYQKGAMVLCHLRDIIGEPAFRRVVGFYLETNSTKPVTTAKLMQAIEETTGWNPRRFFDNYVFGSGHFELNLEVSLKSVSDELTCLIQVDGKSHLSSQETSLETFIAYFGENGLLREDRLVIDVSHASISMVAPRGTVFCVVDPRATIVGVCKIIFAEELSRTILARYSEHKNGYFAWLASRSLLEKQGAHVFGVLPGILDWLQVEKSARARAAAYSLLGSKGALVRIDDLRPMLDKEQSLIGKEALLSTLGKIECPDQQHLVEDLLRRASNEKEVFAYRRAAIRALCDLYSRSPQLRLNAHCGVTLDAALQLMADGRHFGSIAVEAARLVAELITLIDMKKILALVDNHELPGQQRRAALSVCAKLSQRFPEARRDLRPALVRYLGAWGPQSLTAALPSLWLMSGDPHYDTCFQKFIGQKSYGLNSFHIPQARRAYKSFLALQNGSDLKSKLVEVEDLTRRVLRLEAALQSKESGSAKTVQIKSGKKKKNPQKVKKLTDTRKAEAIKTPKKKKRN